MTWHFTHGIQEWYTTNSRRLAAPDSESTLINFYGPLLISFTGIVNYNAPPTMGQIALDQIQKTTVMQGKY